MKLAYTILYVANVAATVKFYTTAFGLSLKFMTPEEDYAELITGDTTLAFASENLGKSNFSQGFTSLNNLPKPAGFELAFTTEHIEDDFKKALNAGGEMYEPITEKPWGQQVGYIKDINGVLIEICTPIKS